MSLVATGRYPVAWRYRIRAMHTQLINSLLNPECYPHPVESVELVETHISWLLLAGDRVYKLKKPLDLGFLDFSTLAKRRFFCEEEMRLNQRTAPDLYLDVISITGTPEQPALNGTGDILEYAVRMRRFDAEAGFDRLLTRHQLKRQHIAGLGQALAELHRLAEVAAPDSDYGTVSATAAPIQDNFTDLATTLKNQAIAAGLGALQDWTEAELSNLEPCLEERLRRGYIRECHGDAHLGNVALIDGRATLFDCVEFSKELRWIDVMSDVAFAVMDLHSRGASGFAWLLLDQYLAATGDYAGLRLLPLYLVHRALVRAKVTALRLDDPDVDTAALLRRAADYLALARSMSAARRPAIVLTVGVSGSGKSWLAQQLVEMACLVRLRSDVERKRLYRYKPGDNRDSGIDRDLYSEEASARTYHYLAAMARCVVEAGMPALIDAAALKHWQRSLFGQLAAECGVPFGILYCNADDATLRRRIVARELAGNDPSDAGLSVLEHQQRTLEPLDAQEEARALLVDSVAQAADWVEQLTLYRVGHVATT